jgi:ribosomal protein L37AE/L43A
MMVFEDMLESTTGDILHDIGVSNKRACKNKPNQCPDCNDNSIKGIEIIGAYDGPILWGCMHCGFLQRRFNKKDTEQMLDTVKNTYTNPNDWGWRSRSDFS